MRQKEKNGSLSVQAVAGTDGVLLGLNLPRAECPGLLGFAIRRHDHTEGECAWLRGYKTFESVEPDPAQGLLYSTRRHPIQGFTWSDFSAKPGYDYTYEVTALRGKPAQPEEAETVSAAIRTEQTAGAVHEIHFNRGASASQEYARRFGDKPPQVVGPAAFKWLSRGVAEAIRGFIGRAEGPGWGLRVCAYEFTEEHVLQALREAWQGRGVDVRILYHARNDDQKDANEEKIREFGLEQACQGRSARGISLSHNKVIVLVKDGAAQAVLTGSTNFSEGGIYGHSNVVHICEDREVSQQYLWLWDELARNTDRKVDAPVIAARTPLPEDPGKAGITPIFSPRPGLEALEWYARQAREAGDALFMTFAFGMDPLFQAAYRDGKARLRYALMEKMSGPARTEQQRKENEDLIIALRKMPQNKFAIGGHLRQGLFNRWLSERLSGLNRNVRYLHTKYMLVDPLSSSPLVVSGSANFSEASTLNNDENMLIIRGDLRAADIYLVEFMRLYNHFAFRDWLLQQPDTRSAEVTHLDEKDEWWQRYFGNTFAANQRRYFAGQA